jgi:exopolysaccharide production protein ExoY
MVAERLCIYLKTRDIAVQRGSQHSEGRAMGYDGFFRYRVSVDRSAVVIRSQPQRQSAIHVFDANASRLLDVIVAAVALMILLPVMVIFCLGIMFQDGGFPIFVHYRIGRGGKPFPCLKLRTMVKDSDERLRRLLESDAAARAEWALDQKLRADPRITRLGAFLRKSSLDELPQLVNVLAGHMSLVGPRPIVAAEVVRYGHYFRFYCAVRPGITGLWQVSGRNDTSYRRRVAMDTVYSRRRSFSTDISILVRTVPAVLASKGSF